MGHWRTTFRKDPAFHPACEAPVLSDPERRWADAESPEWGSPATAPALQQVWPTRAAVLQAIVLLLERWFSWQDSRRGQNKKNRKYAICANTGTVTRRTRDHAAGEVALRCDYAKSIVHSVRYTARRSMFHQAPFVFHAPGGPMNSPSRKRSRASAESLSIRNETRWKRARCT